MLLLKLLSKVLIYSVAALFLAAFFLVVIVYLIVKELSKLAWYTAFPKKLHIDRFGVLTEEDQEDLKSYYKGKGMSLEDYIPWGRVKP